MVSVEGMTVERTVQLQFEESTRTARTHSNLSAVHTDDAVLWVATRPPHVTLAEALVLPTQQGSTVHVHRAR